MVWLLLFIMFDLKRLGVSIAAEGKALLVDGDGFGKSELPAGVCGQ